MVCTYEEMHKDQVLKGLSRVNLQGEELRGLGFPWPLSPSAGLLFLRYCDDGDDDFISIFPQIKISG